MWVRHADGSPDVTIALFGGAFDTFSLLCLVSHWLTVMTWGDNYTTSMSPTWWITGNERPWRHPPPPPPPPKFSAPPDWNLHCPISVRDIGIVNTYCSRRLTLRCVWYLADAHKVLTSPLFKIRYTYTLPLNTWYTNTCIISKHRTIWLWSHVISPEGYEEWHPHNWPVTTTYHLPAHLANYLGHQRVSVFVKTA